MKIEIDTQRDSREDLIHLADMLTALSGSRRSGAVRPRDLEEKPRNVFEDTAPSGGLFNMFGDSSSQAARASDPQPAAPSPSQPAQSGTGDLFSIFSSSGSASGGSSQPSEMPAVSTLLSDDEDSRETSSADDIMDDDKIVPY
jgi:hypothetical protein